MGREREAGEGDSEEEADVSWDHWRIGGGLRAGGAAGCTAIALDDAFRAASCRCCGRGPERSRFPRGRKEEQRARVASQRACEGLSNAGRLERRDSLWLKSHIPATLKSFTLTEGARTEKTEPKKSKETHRLRAKICFAGRGRPQPAVS